MALTEAHCCRLLGVSATATLDETRAAYRRIARRMHPDRVGGDGERFKEITAAYNWLVSNRGKKGEARPARSTARRAARTASARRSKARRPNQEARSAYARQQAEAAQQAADEAKAHARAAAEKAKREARRARAAKQKARDARRKARDAERASAESRWDEEFTSAWDAWCRTAERYHAEQAARSAGDDAEAAAAAEERAKAEARPWRPGKADPAGESVERQAEGRTIFGRLKDGFRRVTRRTGIDRVGHDVSLRLPVDIELLMRGGVRHIAINRAAGCPSCQGADAECGVCEGTGRVDLRETIKVTVPAGARAGSRLRLAGKGTAGLDGSADGDLYLLLEPSDIPGFRTEGLDLYGKVTIGRTLAGKGGTVTVDLPRGKVKVSVPRGTRAGDRFRLRGQGLPAWRADGQGDLFLSVQVR